MSTDGITDKVTAETAAGSAAAGGQGGAADPEPGMELLVHGVGGTTPQAMLEDVRTTRVTGDDTASVHRRTDDLADRPWDEERPLREAYCWCNLTSGDGARALWLLLLPFMIANLAHWTRPAAAGHARDHRSYDAAVRLIALSLTVLLTATACAVALDLVAWQCAASAACRADNDWLGALPGDPRRPGPLLALGAALPLAVTGLLWWLSRRTWSAYESTSPPVRPRPDGEAGAALSQAGFWYGRRAVARLRAEHTAAALFTVCAALLAATAAYDGGADGSAWRAAAGAALAALTAAGWLAVVAGQLRHGRAEEAPDEAEQPLLTRLLTPGAVVLTALVLAHTALGRADWRAEGRLPAGAGFFPALMAAQGALVLLLAVLAHRLHRAAPRGERGALAGLGGPAVALLACGLGGVLTGGATERVAHWLDPAAARGEPGAAIAGPPVVLSWEAATIPLLLLVVLGLAVAAVLRVWRQGRRLAPGVRDRYPDESCPEDEARSLRIATTAAMAGLTDSAPAFVGWITGTCLVLGVGAVAGSLTGEPPARAAEDAPGVLPDLAEAAQSLGSWLMGAGVLLLVAMGRRAYRDRGARQTVGILWDVGTFWPRAAHPFAPPCYAERAVPDLSWRMGTWIDATGGRLVISGHSQGSVLAAAAVWQLDAATRSRVALLTHGSPLHRLYGRWFPRYFGPGALASLHRDTPCWRNLWRDTDPIGGPVGVPAHPDAAGAEVPAVDRGPLPDPLHYGRNLRRPLPEPVLGHGDYAADPAYAAERTALFRRLAPGPLALTATVPGQATAAGAAAEGS